MNWSVGMSMDFFSLMTDVRRSSSMWRVPPQKDVEPEILSTVLEEMSYMPWSSLWDNSELEKSIKKNVGNICNKSDT